jgi:uncharacterized protein YecT (DUF1311 family)
MKIFSLCVAVSIASLTTATAQTAPIDDYAKFTLSKAPTSSKDSRTLKKCLKRAIGNTANTRACYAVAYQRSETVLDAQYQRTLARLAPAAQAQLSAAQAAWRNNRFDQCANDLASEKGGTLYGILMDECTLAEMARRTAWIKRQR